jgi:uncharacterized membrane protein
MTRWFARRNSCLWRREMTNSVNAPVTASGSTRLLAWAALALGLALGGFFDGILLHQILQWHHLLSGLEGARFGDLRAQILADGICHGMMYVIAAIGLWLLWRARGELASTGAGRVVAAFALIGFGAWHVADGVLSHWLLGIHRIRMDAGNPLFWDLLWFAVFGVAFIVGGWMLLRKADGNGSSDGRRRSTVTSIVLVCAVLIAGPVAAMPPPGASTVMVLFKPGMSAGEMFEAVAVMDGRVVWNDASGQLWAIELDRRGDGKLLYRHGALMVSSGPLPSAASGGPVPDSTGAIPAAAQQRRAATPVSAQHIDLHGDKWWAHQDSNLGPAD